MLNASLRFKDRHAACALKRIYLVVLICLFAASHAFAQGKQQTISGYAEYYKNGFLIVEGQRIAANQFTVFKKVTSLAGTPLGYEVKVKGVRQPDGTFLATQLEAKPNGISDVEPDALAGANAVENLCVSKGMLLEQGPDGEWKSVGKLITEGPAVERVRNIMVRLLPPYVRPDRIRVRLVESDMIQASVMANGAVWVYTGILRETSEDELAIVLGHELAHFTHEHMRRKMKNFQWIQLAATIAQGTTQNASAQQLMKLTRSKLRGIRRG